MLGNVVSEALTPDPTHAQPHAPRRVSRLRALLAHPQLSGALLALLIGFASVFSAVVAWQASLASIDASRYQSLDVQQQARQQQIERELESIVAQDERFVSDFQEHSLDARELQAQADSLRDSDPQIADQLDLEAQGKQALARAMQPFFLGAYGLYLDADGSVPYDRAYVLTNLAENNVELRELRNQNTAELGDRADAKAVNLVLVAAIIVGALFFLTGAEVTRRRPMVRRVFFASGGLMVLVGTLAFFIVEILA